MIPAQGNRDWREESRRKRQRSGLPGGGDRSKGKSENGGQDADGAGGENDGVKGMPKAFGLTVMERRQDAGDDGQEVDGQKPEKTAADAEPAREQTLEDRAIASLLGHKTDSALVVPVTEDDAFRADYSEAPDMASLDAYAAMPIEDFGAALLRGMGWKEGQAIGRQYGSTTQAQGDKQQEKKKPPPPKSRPALLGIGAKEDAAVGVELGAWGKGAKGSKGRGSLLRTEYTPVVMRNAKTGEQLTEEELQRKLERQTLEEAEDKSKARDRDRERERERRRSRDRDRNRDDKERRHRRDSRDRDERRDKDRRRDRDEDQNRDRKREKDRDRDGEGDRHRSSRRDRSGSRDRHERRHRDDRRDDRRDERRDKDRRARDRDRDRSAERGSSRRERR